MVGNGLWRYIDNELSVHKRCIVNLCSHPTSHSNPKKETDASGLLDWWIVIFTETLTEDMQAGKIRLDIEVCGSVCF